MKPGYENHHIIPQSQYSDPLVYEVLAQAGVFKPGLNASQIEELSDDSKFRNHITSKSAFENFEKNNTVELPANGYEGFESIHVGRQGRQYEDEVLNQIVAIKDDPNSLERLNATLSDFKEELLSGAVKLNSRYQEAFNQFHGQELDNIQKKIDERNDVIQQTSEGPEREALEKQNRIDSLRVKVGNERIDESREKINTVASEMYERGEDGQLKPTEKTNQEVLEADFPKYHGFEEHHVIPQSLGDHELIKKAGLEPKEFIEEEQNRLLLPSTPNVPVRTGQLDGIQYGHSLHNSHPETTAQIKTEMDNALSQGASQGWNQDQYRTALENIQETHRTEAIYGRASLGSPTRSEVNADKEIQIQEMENLGQRMEAELAHRQSYAAAFSPPNPEFINQSDTELSKAAEKLGEGMELAKADLSFSQEILNSSPQENLMGVRFATMESIGVPQQSAPVEQATQVALPVPPEDLWHPVALDPELDKRHQELTEQFHHSPEGIRDLLEDYRQTVSTAQEDYKFLSENGLSNPETLKENYEAAIAGAQESMAQGLQLRSSNGAEDFVKQGLSVGQEQGQSIKV